MAAAFTVHEPLIMMPGLAAHSTEDMFAMSQKISLTKATFFAYILPPVAILYLMGVLVQLKETRFYRLALLPVIAWFSWRGVFVDMSGGDPKLAQMNTILIVSTLISSSVGCLDVVHSRLICPPSSCTALFGLLHESLFTVKVLQRD